MKKREDGDLLVVGRGLPVRQAGELKERGVLHADRQG